MFVTCQKVKQVDDIGVFLITSDVTPAVGDDLSRYSADLELIQPWGEDGKLEFKGSDYHQKTVYGYGLIAKGQLIGAERLGIPRCLWSGDLFKIDVNPIKQFIL